VQSKLSQKFWILNISPKINPRPSWSHTDGPGGEIGDTLEQSRSNGRELLALIEVTWYLLAEHSEGFGGWAFDSKIWTSGFPNNGMDFCQTVVTECKQSTVEGVQLSSFVWIPFRTILIRKVTNIAFNCCSGSVSFHAYLIHFNCGCVLYPHFVEPLRRWD